MADGDEHLGRTAPQELKIATSTADYGRDGYVTPPVSAPPAPRTIVSGVDRIFGAMDSFSPLADDFAEFVATLSGGEKSVADEVQKVTDSTVAHVHSAADAVEGMFARMAELVKRAKAAHG